MVRNCAPENLEIPRCAIAHLRSGPSDHPGMTAGDVSTVIARRASDEAIRCSACGGVDCFRLRSLSYGGQVATLAIRRTITSGGTIMSQGKRIVLASRPVGEPKPTDFRLEDCAIPTPGAGEVLLRTIWLSLDPYMRGRMSEGPSYAAPVPIGGVVVGGGGVGGGGVNN